MFRFFWQVVLLLAPATALCGDNWPQFRGPRGDGQSDAVGLPLTWSEKENIRWKAPIHGRGWSSPVIWGDQIWLTTATTDGKQMFAVCVDMNSGEIVRDLKLFENEKPSPIHDLNSYASPTPVIEAGRVYINFGSYGTACLDTKSGEVLWQRRDLPCEHFRGPGSSPILFGDLLILHFDGFDFQYVVALDKKTGKTIWKTDRNVDFGTADGDIKKAFATPLVIEVAGKKELISPCSKAVVAYDPTDGKELWRVRHNKFSATARPVFGHGLLYINTGFGSADLLAIRPEGEGDLTDTNVVWKFSKSVGSKPSPVLVDDRLFFVHDSGVATSLDAKSGSVLWSHRLGGNYSSSPIVAEGHIYFSNQEGQTSVLRAGGEYDLLGQNKLDDGCMASPAVVGKAIILRTREALYRIEKGK